MQLTDEARKLLERLDAAIDPEWEARKIELWKQVLQFELSFEDLMRKRPEPVEAGPWPKISINEAFYEREKMLLSQLGAAYGSACARSDRVLNIRTNYGTCILPSAFGVELFMMDDELNCLPTNHPLPGDNPLDTLLEGGMPDVDAELVGKCFATAEYFQEAIAPYPNIREHVWIYHPDFQGPIDVLELDRKSTRLNSSHYS